MRLPPRLVGCAVGLLLFLAATTAHAQGRNAQIAAAQQAYDGFDPARAAQLLRVAINPAIGPTDSSWARGVQLLIQILLEDKKDSLANVWARWAVRLTPGLRVDSVTFLPQVVSTIRAARNLVASRPGPGEPLTRTTWDWDWPSAGVRDPMGGVRPGPATVPAAARVLVVGVGLLTPGQTLPLTPGTYDIQATADGYVTARVSREILPGATTILDFSMQTAAQAQAAIAAAESLPDDVRSRAVREVVRLTVRRFGLDPSCTTGVLAGRDGLVLTTYQSIRGADALEAELSDGTRVRDGLTVASYDVGRNIAVLKVPTTRADSLATSGQITDGQAAWELGLSNCQAAAAPAPTLVHVASWRDRPAGLLQLADSVAARSQGGLLIDRSGAVVGLEVAARSALPANNASDILDRARGNVGARQLLSLADVGRREKHQFGSVVVRSVAAGAVARVSPQESWQWPELARLGPVPLTFAGPTGRYRVELLSGGQTAKDTIVTIAAGVQTSVTIGVQLAQTPAGPGPVPEAEAKKGKSPLPFILIGGVGAGAAAFLLTGKKSSPPPVDTTTTTGTINVSVPVNP